MNFNFNHSIADLRTASFEGNLAPGFYYHVIEHGLEAHIRTVV